MHVKEQVKEFVHDVKRKFSFSQKHKRDTCSTSDSCGYPSADTVSHLDDSSSFSISSGADTSERDRFSRFIRPRTSSTTSKKQHYHNVLHKVKRAGSKRYRLFSAPTVPSDRMVEPTHPQAVSYEGPESFGPSRTLRTSQDCSDVVDVSVRGSTLTGSEGSEVESTPPSSSRGADLESQSDTSGTLVTATSASDFKKAASESDSRFDSVDLHSDANSEKVVPPASPAILPMADLPPPPPPKPDSDEDHHTPAPVYIPRLTAPSMFLPIPNVVLGIILCAHLFASICGPETGVVTLAIPPFIPPPSRFSPPTSEAVIPPRPPISTDPLSALLTKYVPAEQRPRRDVAGEYAGRDVHEMVMSNSWRALAKMARDRIVASDPEDLARILDLWSLRLSALARLRLTNQASAECTNLFAVLNAVSAASVPGTYPGSGSLATSTPLPSSPAPAVSSPLSPSGLSGLAQLPGTPSQKSSTLPSAFAAPASVPRQGTHELMHPFELTVFHARVHYWSGDPLGYIDALSRILARCKERAREEGRVVVQRREAKARVGGDVESVTRLGQTSKDVHVSEDTPEDAEDQDQVAEESTEDAENRDEEEKPDDVLIAAEANLSMWLERIARICLILASQMIEMNDYQAAVNLLTPLCIHRAAPTFLPTPTVELNSALARVYLLSGNLQKAEEHFSIAASASANSANEVNIAMNTALLTAASGDWTRSEEALSEIVTKDPGNFTAINNLAVTLLSQGRIKEGIDLLEAVLKTSPSSAVVAEPFLFNLSTLYELRSAAAIDKKRGLLIEVAKWSGDGLKTSCLKMPLS